MNDIEKKLEALKAEFLGKLEAKETKIQKRQEKLKPWKPERGEKYFTIENRFDVVQYTYCEDDIDESNIQFGNCFRTKERAEQVADKMRLLLRLEQLHDMLCPDYVPDWNNDGELKFCLAHHCDDDCWFVDYFNVTQYPTVYFDTEENAQKAAEILNKEMRESK
jgi:hypothetical protein